MATQPTSTPEYFKLDWRTTITKRELINRVDSFLTTLDSAGKLKVHLLNSTSKGVVAPETRANKHQVLQKVVTSVKRYQGGVGPSASRTDKYVSRMVVLIQILTKYIDGDQQITPRKLWYNLSMGDFTEQQIDQLWKDLALSIKVHPYSLGIVPQSQQSFVRVPSGSEVRCSEVVDIFRYNRNVNQVVVKTIRGGVFAAIPPLCRSLTVKEPETTIRAIIVCEHRNLRDSFEKHADEPGFEGILLVLLGGFPDTACREFLHLLALNKSLSKVPFLWFSDCDSHSLQMYSVLKYGSAHLAYATPSMVCPQLVFVGLTLAQLEAFTLGYPDRYITFKSGQQTLSVDDTAKIRQVKEAYVDSVLTKLRRLPTSQQNVGDRERIVGLKKQKTLELPGESSALAQLRRFEAGSIKLSLYSLDHFESDGVARCILEQVAAARGETLSSASQFGSVFTTPDADVQASDDAMANLD